MREQIKVLRTPDTAFNNLPDYPFKPNYMDINGLRMHYVDEGDRDNKVIFLFHGQPTWSYLYRHFIPELVKAGYRVIAPDLIGFGKSDKPVDKREHTYTVHVEWMTTFVDRLGIKNAAAFMQDWGGMIGLRVLANRPQWLDRLVVANTALAEVKGLGRFIMPRMLKLLSKSSGKPSIKDFAKKINYGNWASYLRTSSYPDIGELVQLLTTKDLTKKETDAYNAPFPDTSYHAGPRTMAEIVATDLKDVYKDWQLLKKWEKPVLTLFSDRDPFLAEQGYDDLFQKNFKGSIGQPHMTVSDASHFLQEDKSSLLTDRIVNWLQETKF